MKDGSVLTGEVVNNVTEDPEVVLQTATKKISVARETIRVISLDENARAEQARRSAALRPESTKGHAELAEWCAAKGLYGRAETEWRIVLAADPSHRAARVALGLPVEDPRKDAAPEEFLIVAAAPASPELTDLERQVVGHARALGLPETAEEAKQEAVRGLLQERAKAGEVLLGCLDFRKHTEAQVRLGALKGLQVVKPAGDRTPITLAWSTVMDPAADVRKAATELIKERKDLAAMGVVMRHLIGAFDEQGNVVNAPARDNAVAALRSVNDRRVPETLLYYSTMEVRATATQAAVGDPIQIRVPTFYQTGGNTVSYVVDLPIYFPKVSIQRVRTTVCAPAAALRALTGQNFGDDTQAWLKWIRSQP
jgi:hypothetical protein